MPAILFPVIMALALVCITSVAPLCAASPPCGRECTTATSNSHANNCPNCRRQSELARAGRPHCVSKFAVPSNGYRYAGYYVGGTTPFRRRGSGRYAHEGTWGWDYWGGLFKRHVSLNWLHGRDAGRNFGSYETDGPKISEKIHVWHDQE